MKIIPYVLVAVTLLAILFSFPLSCTNDPDSHRTLESSGYTDIALEGYDWFACGKDDAYHTKFTAMVKE